jgi:parallel beta-helix repeat protein
VKIPPPRQTIEPLEARIAPATFIVSTGADSGPGSLRQAILDANALPGLDSITFSTPHLIKLATHLPAITDRINITGFLGTATKVSIDGTSATGADGANNASGLLLFGPGSGHSTIQGLAIYGFDLAGIEIVNSSNNLISANYLGLDAKGSLPTKGMTDGILVNGGSSNIIGNVLSSNGRNIIGGNDIGIHVTGGAKDTRIDGNYIGILSAEAVPRSNDIGILIEQADNTIIGKSSGNQISYNHSFGIKLTASARVTTITQNTIGSSFGNGYTYGRQDWGIFVDGADQTIIGGGTYGPSKGLGNTIANNTSGGIWIRLASSDTLTRIEGNLIGSNNDQINFGNGGPGIFVTRPNFGDSGIPSLNITGNQISGNLGAGIELLSSGTRSNTTISGNLIGAAGPKVLTPAGNGDGIVVDGFDSVKITGNTIVSSRGDGLLVNNSTYISVLWNNIGCSPTSQTQTGFGNAGDGIRLLNVGTVDIGTDPQGSILSNRIVSNSGDGIFLDGDGLNPRKLTPMVTMVGNYIGTDSQIEMGNDGAGIRVNDVLKGFVKIGGYAGVYTGGPAGRGNVIIGNLEEGIVIQRSNGITIGENLVSSSHTALALEDADATVVLKNEFKSENGHAVVFDRETTGTVFGNLEAGNRVVSQQVNSLLIANGRDNTLIGNRFESPVAAIVILSGENNSISRNQFHIPDSGLFVDLGANGRTLSDPLDTDSGPNTLLNSPLLVSAAVRGGQTLLRGEYRGMANSDFRIEWYVDGEFLVEMDVHTDNNGVAKLKLDLDQAIDVGSKISASATVALNTSEFSPSVVAASPPEVIAKGAPPGQKPRVQLRDALTGDVVLDRLAFAKAFRGGISVATADVDGDGFTDLIATPRSGNPTVKVFSGLDGHELSRFSTGAAGPAIRSLAAGDLDGDGTIEVILGRSKVMGGPVSIYDALTGAPEARFTPFGFNTPDRLKLSLSDTDGDGRSEITVQAEVFGELKRVVLDPLSGEIERLARAVRG